MPAGAKAERKQAYFNRVQALFDEYNQGFIATSDNVSASHLSSLRKMLRQYNAIILMGKNTLMRKALRDHMEANPKIESIIPHVKGNMGFILCKGHLKEVLEILEKERVAAPAKAGAVAPVDVVLPAGNTGLEPTQTSFLQALNIATKISKGQIEILKDVHLLKVGDKVGSSESALLQKLNIKPFSYGLSIRQVFDDGNVFPPKVLKLTDADIVTKFLSGVQRIAGVSLAIGYPTLAALPHAIVNGFRRIAAISIATDYVIEQTAEMKKLLDDPEALAKAAAAAAAAAAASAAPAAAAQAEEKKEEPEEEEEEEAVEFDLFG